MNFVDAAGKDPDLVNGDPEKFGASVVDVVEEQGLFQQLFAEHDNSQVLRIQFGSDCYGMFGAKVEKLSSGYAKMANLAKSTDVDN